MNSLEQYWPFLAGLLALALFVYLFKQNLSQEPYTPITMNGQGPYPGPDNSFGRCGLPGSPTLLSRQMEQMSNLYDGNLYDPSMVDVTTEGPYHPLNHMKRRDCLHLRSPSTVVMSGCNDGSPASSLKTSSQWYLSRPDPDHVILCPNGWMDLVNPTQWWYSHLITFDEYSKRLAKSTVGPVDFPEMKNEQPF